LYAGIMLTPQGPRVLEFNVRFGDPETQVILPRLKTDLVEIMLATCSGRLSDIGVLKWDSRSCVCVVCASGGYPGPYAKNKEITGLDEAEAAGGVVVFHAGTIRRGETGQYLTSGGRVLGVTGMGATIKEATRETYHAVSKINFEGMHYRKDIGRRALNL
jgi:phosphoribosylamine--glycine ligase